MGYLGESEMDLLHSSLVAKVCVLSVHSQKSVFAGRDGQQFVFKCPEMDRPF